MNAKTIKQYLLISLGSIALALGVLGIFLPVLPTTPFLLLASFCYIRSSERLYNWLINHRILGAYIHNYLVYKAVKKSTKISVLLIMWLGMGFSIWVVANIYIRILLLVIGIGVSIHLLSLKTLSESELAELSSSARKDKRGTV